MATTPSWGMVPRSASGSAGSNCAFSTKACYWHVRWSIEVAAGRTPPVFSHTNATDRMWRRAEQIGSRRRNRLTFPCTGAQSRPARDTKSGTAQEARLATSQPALCRLEKACGRSRGPGKVCTAQKSQAYFPLSGGADPRALSVSQILRGRSSPCCERSCSFDNHAPTGP